MATILCAFGPQAIAQSPDAPKKIEWPDVQLTDQSGETVSIRDLIKGHVFAVNTIFTSCTTTCPVAGANFSKLSRILAEGDGRNVRLISISTDPSYDSPERLKEWSAKFGPSKNWTLLTGPAPDVNRLLKTLDLFSAEKTAHSSLVILGSDITGEWTRVDGLASPTKIADRITTMVRSTQRVERAASYFGNTPLLDQDGNKLRFYDDLLKGKVVVIDAFFTTCSGTCPRMSGVFAAIQGRLGSRLGADVNLISISVDPAVDTPEKLKQYGARFQARPGWRFITGNPAEVNQVLAKLGEAVNQKEDHLNVFLVGNERTGLWKKVFGLSPPEEIMKIVESVLTDRE